MSSLETYALFMVILSEYAEPKTEGSNIDVRMLSMIVVGPKQYANAKTPRDAAAPVTLLPKQSKSIDVKTPQPQKTTCKVV